MSPKNKPRLDQVPLQARFPLRETLLAATALFGAGLLAYSNSFAGQFIFDDGLFIDNLRTHSLWEYLAAPASRSRPVVSLSLAANYAISGLNIWSYHIFNLTVHLLAALTLFGIVRRTLRLDGLRARFDAAAGWLALAVALLWLVHPLQTESVTYIWQRCESLAGLFYLLTLYGVMRGASGSAGFQPANGGGQDGRAPSARRWYALAIMACAAGMACKATLVTAPVVVFAYDRIFLAKDAAAALRKRWGLYAGLAAAWLILAAFMFISPPDTIANFGLTALSPAAYAQTQCGVILHYLRLSFWPVALCLDYLWPAAQRLGEILPGALVVGTLLLATLWAWVRHPAWSFPGVWFFVILAPTSSFLPLLEDLAFEHRMYLPLAAVVVLTVVGAYLLGAAFLRRLSVSKARRRTLGGLAAAGALVTATVLLGYLTYQRNTDYQDPLAMWDDVLKQRPENWRAYNNRGEEREKKGDCDGAVADYNKALELNPRDAEAFSNRGAARDEKGDYDGAIMDYNKALELNPRYEKAYNNRGVARDKKGGCDGAIADCTKALELNPHYAEAYNNRGVARRGKRDYDGAIADYTQALALNPRYAEACYNRGNVRRDKGDYDGALADYNQALELNPRLAEAYSNRGLARQDKGDYGGAAADYTKALELNPRYAEAYYNRGNARQDKGDYDGAVADYSKALALNPRYAAAYNNRGVARLEKGDYDGALADCTKALALNPRSAEAYSNRGLARQDKGDYDGALADYDQTLAFNRSNWQTWMNKGLLLVKTGKEAEAQACFAESLKINPGLRSSLADRITQVRAERQALLTKAQAEK